MSHTLTISEQLNEQLTYVKQILREMTGQEVNDEELIGLLLSAFSQSITNETSCCGWWCWCNNESFDDEVHINSSIPDEEFDEEAHHLKHIHKKTHLKK